jgi:shikimate kinase
MTICVLIGIPGAGKTTIGRELAKKLDADFIDTDREIEAKAGKTVADIFIEDGESEFRSIEKVVVLASLKNSKGVVSLGGGSVIEAEVRDELKHHQTYWLQTSINSALKRTSANTNRPLLLESPRATLIRLLEQRTGFYESVAKKVIDTDNRNVKSIVDEIYADLANAGAL